MLNTLKRLVLEEEGQGMAEYALILVFVALVCIVGFRVLGNQISDKAEDIGTTIETETP
ncbi:MAG TPA: Flp family type IVb pilin [Syntrophomonas sp.]|nr:Flp family type IVb pilin [Syntrophomonas sp.]